GEQGRIPLPGHGPGQPGRKRDAQNRGHSLTHSNFRLFIYLLLAFSFQLSPVFAKETGGQVAQFMSFGGGARSLAMARAFFAVSDDASSVYSNPAGMTQLEKKEVSFMQATLVEQANMTAMNYVHPT